MSEIHNEQYIIRDKIGEGGMGTVYLGEDVLLERPVAIKVMNNPEQMAKDSLEVRFQQEALALARLNHPNITHLYAFIPKGDTYWMVMEYVEGKTLEEWLKIHGSFDEKTACSILCQILDGLAHAHQKGIIHRDLKPANVMISSEGEVKIMDFGIARIKNSQRLTQLGKSVGTIEYMAPEQIQGKEGNELTDIYAAGNILYEMLSGQTPFKADTDYHLMKMKLEEKIPRHPVLLGKTSSSLQEVIFKSLAANPAKRFANAVLFKDAILKNIGEGLYSYNELSIALGQEQRQIAPVADDSRVLFLKKSWLNFLSSGVKIPGNGRKSFYGVEKLSVNGILSYFKDWNVNKSIALLIIAVVLSGSMVLWSALQSNQNEDIPGGSDISTTDISAASLSGNRPERPSEKSSGIIEEQLIRKQQPIIRFNTTEGEEKSDSSVRKEVVRSAPAKKKENPPADKKEKEKEQILPNEPASPPEPAQDEKPEPVVKPSGPVAIPEGRTIQLMLDENVSSEDKSKDGTTISLHCTEDIKVNGTVIIKQGATAIGKIVDVVPSGKRKKALIGFVVMKINAADGKLIRVRSERFRLQSESAGQAAIFKSGSLFSVKLVRGTVF